MADTVLDGLNRYSYVRNNPLRYTNPSGHCVLGAPCPLDEIGDAVKEGGDRVGDAGKSVVGAVAGVIKPEVGQARSAAGYSSPLTYISSEMRRNRPTGLWLAGDIQFAWNARPNGPWDHKSAIAAEFGSSKPAMYIAGQKWKISVDVWSNIHFGFLLADLPARFNYVYEDCAQYKGSCGWADTFGHPFGEANELDDDYVRAGVELNQLYPRGDWTDSELETFLAPRLREWSGSADPTRPAFVWEGLWY